MKKTISLIVAILLLGTISIITYLKYNENSDLEKIKMAEVTHSVFYAPMYVAIEEGYFEEEGIEIDLILTPGADKVSAAVLSNDVNIGFAGTESSIYVYTGGEEDYLQTFAGLTKRDGQFIVSRKDITDFTVSDMIGKTVLVGRKGGMPALSFEKAVENEGVKSSDVDMDYSIEFAALTGAFIGGNGDFVNLFQPNALKLVKEGYGYIVGSVGLLADEVPYTAFYARKSYISENEELLTKFTNAIAKGLDYVKNKSSEEIAKSILKQFPDTSLNDLTAMIESHKTTDAWLESPFISEESFNNLLDIMIDADQIEEYVPYSKLIKNIYEK